MWISHVKLQNVINTKNMHSPYIATSHSHNSHIMARRGESLVISSPALLKVGMQNAWGSWPVSQELVMSGKTQNLPIRFKKNHSTFSEVSVPKLCDLTPCSELWDGCYLPDVLVVFKLWEADGALLRVVLRVISAPLHLKNAATLKLLP